MVVPFPKDVKRVVLILCLQFCSFALLLCISTARYVKTHKKFHLKILIENIGGLRASAGHSFSIF